MGLGGEGGGEGGEWVLVRVRSGWERREKFRARSDDSSLPPTKTEQYVESAGCFIIISPPAYRQL